MIQFIVTGWHYNQKDTYDALSQLEKMNDDVKVFFSCHKEPPRWIRDIFDYKLFYNGAEECGAFDQAMEHLNLSDDTVIFFLHDDLIIKSLEFINICIDRLNQGYKVIGNGRDYADTFNPNNKTEIGIKEEFDGATFKDYVKDENQHLFDSVLQLVKVRPSFICMTAGSVKEMGGFEPRREAYIPPLTEPDEWCPDGGPHYRGTKGLGSFGNLFPALNCYKMNKIFGQDKITWLSNTYVDSDYIYECQRGLDYRIKDVEKKSQMNLVIVPREINVSKKLSSINNINFYLLHKVSFEVFDEFLDGLDEENKTWALDKQTLKTRREFYDAMGNAHQAVIALDGHKLVGLWSSVGPTNNKTPYTNALPYTLENKVGMYLIYSYVVKKEYQRKGLAKVGLSTLMNLNNNLIFNHFRKQDGLGKLHHSGIDCVVHQARTNMVNKGSRYLLRSLKYTAMMRKDGGKLGGQIAYARVDDSVKTTSYDWTKYIFQDLDYDLEVKNE